MIKGKAFFFYLRDKLEFKLQSFLLVCLNPPSGGKAVMRLSRSSLSMSTEDEDEAHSGRRFQLMELESAVLKSR